MDEQAVRSSILVIDDELGVRESMRYLFKNEYEVLLADSVDKGIGLLRESRPDAIIMDIRMPEKTGIEGLREIRAIDSEVAVVMLTGFGSLDTAQEAIRYGANDYIKKPFDMLEMRRVVDQAVRHTQVERKRASTARDLEALNLQLKNELQVKEHLASLGQASSEFVHDLRNPLTVICGYVQLLIDDLAQPSYGAGNGGAEALDYLDIIARNAKRCQEMSQMWRNLSNRESLSLSRVRVAELIDEVVAGMQTAAARHGTRTEIEAGPADCVIMADSVQMFRALQNLANNAVQSIGEAGGVVRFRWSAQDGAVTIEVQDSGAGIPDELIDRVFEPNFTTKAGSGGMGLGLFITRKIIELHSGTILLANRPAGGAVASIHLPLAGC